MNRIVRETIDTTSITKSLGQKISVFQQPY